MIAEPELTLGNWPLNRVHQVDCLEGLKMLPAESIDAIVTSPPYWGQRGDDGIGIETDPREYVENLTAIFLEANRTLKPHGVLWINIGDAYNTPINWKEDDYVYSTLGADKQGLAATNSAYTKNRGNRRAYIDKNDQWLQYGNLLALPFRLIIALCDRGMLYRGEVIWAKRKAMPEGRCRRPHRKHESIYIMAKSERHAFTTHPPVPSIWDVKAGANQTQHTSTFPDELPMMCIQASGLERGAVVLDPFMGSGTTGLAAKKLGFNFLGFELNETNARIANERIGGMSLSIF